MQRLKRGRENTCASIESCLIVLLPKYDNYSFFFLQKYCLVTRTLAIVVLLKQNFFFIRGKLVQHNYIGAVYFLCRKPFCFIETLTLLCLSVTSSNRQHGKPKITFHVNRRQLESMESVETMRCDVWRWRSGKNANMFGFRRLRRTRL